MNIQTSLRDRHIIHSAPEIMSGALFFVGTRVPIISGCRALSAEFRRHGLAEARSFDVFINVNENLLHQQNLSGVRLRVVILDVNE